MNGYFSRLMKQSGIAVEPAGEPGSRFPVQPPDGPGERDATIPARLDREELVESQRGDPTEETQEGSEVDPGISGLVVEEGAHNPAEQVLHSKVPEAPPRSSEEGQQHRQSRPSERRECDACDSERTPPSLAENTRELPERRDAVEGDAGREALEHDETIGGATHRADERSFLGVKTSEEALAFAPGEGSRDPISQERVWQNTLKEVREWVTGSPVADDEEAENRDVSRTKDTININADSLFVEERVAASYPKPTAPSPHEELATQDLRIEIGTISVTVEEPQKQIPKSSRRTETAEKKSAGNSERSRLSRHYVRVR